MLDSKQTANRFIVDRSLKDDSSVVSINQRGLSELKLFKGDTVLVKRQKNNETLAIVVVDYTLEDNKIGTSKALRKTLRVKIGDVISVAVISNLPILTQIHVLPIAETIEGISGDFSSQCLGPHFNNTYRPVKKGDVIMPRGHFRSIEFKIVACEPYDFGIVAPSTLILTEGEPIKRDSEGNADDIGYDDVGGHRKQINQIRRIFELPLRHPEFFGDQGIKSAYGVLLSGPVGSGKALIAQAVANETGSSFFLIEGFPITSQAADEAVARLKNTFEEAEKKTSAIIFIDEIEAIFPQKIRFEGDKMLSETKRVASHLVKLMAEVKTHCKVIAATCCLDSIGWQLWTTRVFAKVIHLGNPDEAGRMEILKIQTKNMRLAEDVVLEDIVDRTQGFVGADIANLCSEVGYQSIKENMDLIDLEDESIPFETLDKIVVRNEYFLEALTAMHHSNVNMTNNAIQSPMISWQDVGGLEGVKRVLQEMILYPASYPEKLPTDSLFPLKSVLLYGPPGCGKTLLAKAAANECSANLFSVNYLDLFDSNTRPFDECFSKFFYISRFAEPCILFLDQLDCIFGSQVTRLGQPGLIGDRILNSLLDEIARIEGKRQIFIIATVNDPESILEVLDVLIYPRKFEQFIYVPLPDKHSRLEIMKVNLKRVKLAKETSLKVIAETTEGYSGADLAEICKKATKAAMRELVQNHAESSTIEIAQRHLEEALKNTHKSVTEEILKSYYSFNKRVEQRFKFKSIEI